MMQPLGPHGALRVDMTRDGIVVLEQNGQRVTMTPDEVEAFVRWLAKAHGVDRSAKDGGPS